MKNILKIVFINIIALNILSCVNDDSQGGGDLVGNERIKQVKFYDDNDIIVNKDIYYYDGNKIIKIVGLGKNDSNNWYEYYKEEYNYNANTVTVISYSRNLQDVEWNLWLKKEYLFENDLIKNIKFHKIVNNQWVEEDNRAYQYTTNGQLASWLTTTLDLNGIVKGNCVYANNKLVEHHTFIKDDNDEWIQKSKDLFIYSNSKLKGWTNYYLNSSTNLLYKNYKSEYLYQDNNISSIKYFVWDADNNNWNINTNYSSDYTYNSNGNMLESQRVGSRVLVEYEVGGENLETFRLPNLSIYKKPRFY